jgi:hypothetical protein
LVVSLRVSCFEPDCDDSPDVVLAGIQLSIFRRPGGHVEVEIITYGHDLIEVGYSVAECPPESLTAALGRALARGRAFAASAGAGGKGGAQ